MLRYSVISIVILVLAGCNAVMPVDAVQVKPPEVTQKSELQVLKRNSVTPSAIIPVTTPTLSTSLMQNTSSAQAPETALTTATATQTQIPSSTPTKIFELCCPLANFPRDQLYKTISNGYTAPPLGRDERHQGVDFVFHRLAGVDYTILGVEVQAVLGGVVSAAIEESFPYGNLVIVETPRKNLPVELVELFKIGYGESLYHLYAHMLNAPPVTLGQGVETCQVIGAVGASGNTEAPHLHFETRIGPSGQQFPLMNAFNENTTVESRKYYDLWRISKQFRHFDPMLLLEYDIKR